MKNIRVMTIFGTRPEAIKMAPLALELARRSAEIAQREYDEDDEYADLP